MDESLKTHSKTQRKSADLVSNKLRIGVFQQYQMKCKSVSKKSPRYICGESLQEAANNMEELEETAKLIFILGDRPIRYLTAGEIAELRS